MEFKKKNVLFIHHGGGAGGALLNLLYTIQNLNENKYSIKVLMLYNYSSYDLFLKMGINFEIINSRFYRKNLHYFIHSEVGCLKWYKVYSLIRTFFFWIFSAFIYAPKILRKESVDILHLNSSVLTDWSFAAKRIGIKNVIHIQEPIAKGYLGIRKSLMRNIIKLSADHIIAISQDNANRLNIPDKTTVVYNFVKTKVLNLTKKEEKNVYSNKAVLYAGGAETHKGFFTIVEALDYINQDIKIYFAGNISLPRRYFWQPSQKKNKLKKKLLEKVKNNHNIEFIGLTNDILKLIAKCTATISPFSVPHFSRLVIESFAMKKPAIGSDVEGMDEIIEHSKDGLLFKTNNAKSLAETINYICSNPNKAKEMGKYGYEKYKTNFSENNVKRIELIYDNLNNGN